MAYTEDVNVNLNVLAGAMGGVTAIMGGMSALTSTFGEFGTQAASSFGTVDGILVSATALLVSFGVQASEAFGEFEQGMKIVQTVSGQSNAAINQLTNAANEMSVAYRTSIGDITDGLQTLGRAGLNSATEQLEVLESGLQTAKLEGRNLNGVLEELIQNTSMLGGDLKSVDFGDQASYINSLMVGTSMSAPIDTHDVSQTLQYAGGTAAAAGANLQDKDKLEDLMGTVAAFAQKGVTGSMAGTALRAFFTKPASQDNSVTEGLGMIGLSPYQLWEDGGESMKDVSDQIAIIQGQMDRLNLSAMDQVEIWGKIVGPKMGQQMMKLKSDDIKDLTRDIQEASSAEELATQTLQTYTQKISEMKQQGDLAFREFGEKVAVILLPIVDGITKILGLLSTPVGSIAAFGTVGSIVVRGIRAAWNMISSIYGQFKSMIADARMGIQNINAIAGGSAPGFRQDVAQVEYLNTVLNETDATLQSIQARSLGLKPGYMIPGGLATDKIPSDTLRIYDENVIKDNLGVMGNEKGKYYSGEKKDIFDEKAKDKVKDLKSEIQSLEDDFEQKEILKEQQIEDLVAKREEREKKITEEYRERNKKVKESRLNRIDQIDEKYGAMYDLAPDSYTKESIKAQYQNELNQIENQTAQLYTISKNKAQNALEDVRNKTDEQINRIETHFQDFEGQLNEKIDTKKTQVAELEKVQKNGLSKLQTRLELNTIEEADRWYKDLLDQEKRGIISDEDRYSLERTREVWEDRQNAQALKEMEAVGVKPTYRSKIFEDLSPNDTMLAQIYTSGDFLKMAEAKNNYVQNVADVLVGKGSSDKGGKAAENNLSSFSNHLKSASNSLSNFKTRLQNQFKGEDFLKNEALNLQTASLDKLRSGDLNITGKTFEAGLKELSASVGLTTQEFAVLNSGAEVLGATGLFTEEELGKMAIATELIQKEFIEQLVPMNMEEGERKKQIAALTQSYNAIMREASARSGGAFGGAVSKTGKITGALSKVVNYMGGPFMAAIMGATVAMEAIRKIQENWQQQMQQAQQTFSEAEDKLSSAEENISQTLRDQDNSITDAQIEQYIDYQTGAIQEAYNNSSNPSYSDMIVQEMSTVGTPELTEEQKEQQEQGYVVIPGEDEMNTMEESATTLTIATEENQSELQKNTAALQAATYAYAQAEGLKQKQFQDPLMGWQGESSKLSDGERSLLNFISIANALNVFNMATSFLQKRNEGFLDNNTPLLKSSQADKDYAGSTEFAGIFAADMNDAMRNKSYLGQSDDDSITAGLQQFFGNDYDQIIGLMRNMDNKVSADGYGALKAYGKVFGSMDYDAASKAQLMLKDNKSDFQKLGKQMFRYEQQYGFDPKRTAYGDFKYLRQIGGRGTLADKRAGRAGLGSVKTASGKEVSKALSKAKLTVTDKNLIKTVERLIKLSDNKLTEANVLALGSMQQLQDMYQVANEQVAPGINQTVQGVYDTVGVTSTAASNAGNASDGAFSASNNAAAIAAFLGAQAQETAYNSTRQAAIDNGDATTGGFFGIGAHVMTEDEWRDTLNNNMDPKYDKYRQDTINAIRGAGLQVNHPDYTPDQIKNRTNEITKGLVDDVNSGKVKMKDAMNTATKPLLQFAQGATLAAYGQSPIGEYGSGGSSGGGGGGGGGSGGGSGSNKDNAGTKKERVDLVLCNKKEIPKLNVNLFKKPPNFTILNKNFKLRDIKINSQDKPKAIMNAVKNGIIETQKRMDPKIIQDEAADYDPLESTDGKSVPSGTTKTTT